MRDLLTVANECMAELDALNIPYRTVSIWKVNTRALKRWGQCKRLPDYTFEININQDLLREENDIKGLKETILHELLHTVDGCMNHGSRWQYLANQVNKRYGYNIQRTSSAECKGVSVRRAPKKNYKYKVTCTRCGAFHRYQRMCWTVECCFKGNARCGCGNRSFNVINL